MLSKSSLLGRIERLERTSGAAEPPTIIIRHLTGEPTGQSFTLHDGQTIRRDAAESEQQFIDRAARLAPVTNGVRILHEFA